MNFDMLDKMKASAKVLGYGLCPALQPSQIDELLSYSNIPAKDNIQGRYRYCHNISAETKEVADYVGGRSSGSKLYPPGGFLDWHTNSSDTGFRIYFTHVEEDGGWFRYFINGKETTLVDKPGWNIRAFHISKTDLFWHCVFTKVTRYSFGFNCNQLKDEFSVYRIN